MEARILNTSDGSSEQNGGAAVSGSYEAALAGVAAGPLRVGIATADITPEGPVWLAGFAARQEASRGVHRNLTATCVVFDNGVTRLAILALDLLRILEPQLEALRAAAEEAGIPPHHLMVNCSHTHYAPGIGSEKNEGYTPLFHARTDPLFRTAVEDLKPAVLDYTVGSCTMGINRRQLDAEGKINFRPEPRKQIDPDVPILRVVSPEGEVRAVIFGYACHPTSVGKDEWYLVNTDYPGYAKDWVAAAYPGCTPVFLQGCGADIKPRYTKPDESGYGRFNYVLFGPLETVAELGHEVGRAVVAALMVPPAPVPGDRPSAPAEAAGFPVQLGGIVEKASVPNRKPGEPPHWITMGAWRIGDVYMFGSQCEIGSNIGLRIKRDLAGMRIWTNGYTHWGIGYFMDAASYPEGGYEITASGVSPAGEGILVANAVRYVRTLQAGQTGHGPIRQPEEVPAS